MSLITPNLRAAAAACALVLAVTDAGCKPDGECSEDDDCPAQNACVARICVPRVAPSGYIAAVELDPPQESTHARRDYPAVSFTADLANLELDRKVAVRALLQPGLTEPTDRRSSVGVVLSVPSTLVGRPDLSLDGGGINQMPGLRYDTQLAAPERLLGRPARLRVLPDTPVDQLLCPWQLDVVVAAEMSVALPGDNDTIRIEGKVVAPAPAGSASPNYEARLFAGSRLLSNVGQTDSTGKFMLRAQKDALAGRNDARVEITQAALANPSTTLVVIFAGGDANLGELTLPAMPQPISFVVPVYDAESQGTNLKAPVVGASVRFATRVGGASMGEIHYVRTAQTGAEGTASIPLLPGTGADNREYVVSVVSPPNSVTGSLCVPAYAIGAAVATNRVTATIFLPRKATLTGQVRRFDQRPAPRMTIRATRIDASFPPACGTTLASPPAETTADDDGRYRLLVDPGDYLIEIDPPAGGGLPRQVLPQITVAAPATARDIDLPQGVLVEGKVVAPDGDLVPQTRVRVFPSAVAGPLLGSALTGEDGRFRVVLPRLP